MRVIETTYDGVRFRSRLEAKWAVFFNALGAEWEYEPEAFLLRDGRGYTPDFWLISEVTRGLEGGGAFVEVKPSHNADDSKPRAFSVESDRNIFVVRGQPNIEAAGGPVYGTIRIPPYPFGYDWERFCTAVAKMRAHRFWDPRRVKS